jgi:hypothetical protein
LLALSSRLPNDEGWYLGQCRFSKIAPAWGEFYEVDGDLKLESVPNDWIVVGPESRTTAKHFLFYLRDQTFECDAESIEPLVVLAESISKFTLTQGC